MRKNEREGMPFFRGEGKWEEKMFNLGSEHVRKLNQDEMKV